MPIVDIELVVSQHSDEEISKEQTRRLADALGEVFESRPKGTWVRVRLLPEALYAENAESREDPEYPVFVTLLKAQPPSGDDLAQEMRSVTAVVASILGRPADNVHVVYEPKAAGRISFGGELRRE
jgi:phenylpyruvate tautomerase PptA (4-oxalocrotonate tautomerase family)